jgi:hypothetical protein
MRLGFHMLAGQCVCIQQRHSIRFLAVSQSYTLHAGKRPSGTLHSACSTSRAAVKKFVIRSTNDKSGNRTSATIWRTE